MGHKPPIIYTDTWEGKEYSMTFKEWEDLTGFHKNRMIYRYGLWMQGVIDKKLILAKGDLRKEDKKGLAKQVKVDLFVRKCNQWLCRPERLSTSILKSACLDIDIVGWKAL